MARLNLTIETIQSLAINVDTELLIYYVIQQPRQYQVYKEDAGEYVLFDPLFEITIPFTDKSAYERLVDIVDTYYD